MPPPDAALDPLPRASDQIRRPVSLEQRTWRLVAVSVGLLGVAAIAELAFGDRGPLDLVMVALAVAVAASTLFHRHTSLQEEAGRRSETQTFARILQALSHSVSPDALVSAIVQELGAAAAADHVVFVRLRPNTRVLDATLVTMHPGVPASATVLPASVLDEAPRDVARRRAVRESTARRPPRDTFAGAPTIVADDVAERAGGRGPLTAAERTATRIAGRVSALYGLRYTLAAPLTVEGAVVGAIVLSQRTSATWSPSARRLLDAAAGEASAALARIYSLQEAEARASTDGLTGLPNRRAFDERCAQLAHRRRADAVGVLMIDIDHFKRLNDRHGHATGDAVLRSVAAAIAAAVRADDIPARYGGEEFVVLLRDPTWQMAIEVGERVRSAVEEVDVARFGVEGVTVSVGVAVGDSPDAPIEGLLERADASMYGAKRAGRNRVMAG